MKRHPKVSKRELSGRFTPNDFAEVLMKLPEGCPILGGQAVAWWATKYGISVGAGDQVEPLTSVDMDCWGGLDDLEELARLLGQKPILPHKYEMTVWVGAIPLTINGEKTLVEFLHTVPGLDTHDPNRASVGQNYTTQAGSRILQFLSPVSLALTKLHALRHFPQEGRQDELHLRLCLRASQAFIAQLIVQKAIREALWNCERLIETHHLKPNIKLARQYKFNLLDAVPIEKIAEASSDNAFDEPDRKRLANFCKIRWPQVYGTAA